MANDLIDYKNLFGDIQQKVVDILKDDEWFSDRGITILSENILDIDFQIKNALGKQGCVIVVTTMQSTYVGHDGMVEEWQVDNLEVDCVENPIVHRGNLKKLGFEDGTTTDILYRIAERLGGPQGGHFGMFCPKSCEVGEDSQLVVGKAKFSCACRNDVTGIIDPETKVEIPFVTKVEIADLLAEIDSLKALVEDFSTEEIKADIVDLKEADTELGVRIDGLADVYQPKGNYALISDLAPYALKTQIPVEISQLNNDTGFITELSWDEVKQKPDVALASDIPTNVSQLNNDSNYLTSVSWSQIQDKPDIPENIPTKTSDLVNDSGFLTEVFWNAIQGKPDLIDEEQLDEATRNRPTFSQVDTAIDEKIAQIPTPEDAKKLWNDTKRQYISGSREVFEVQTIPAHWSDWQWNDGQPHEIYIEHTIDDTYCLAIDELHFETTSFQSYEECEQHLQEISSITFETAFDSIIGNREWVEEQQTIVKIADLATTNQIPTKISQLENDSGFITEHQSLENYATTEYVDGKISTEATTRQEAIDQINSELLDKASVDDIPTKTSDLTNDSGFLTEHQSLENYATKQYVDDHVPEEFPWSSISGKPDLVQKDQLDQATQNLQDQIDEINVEIEAQVEVDKVYGQYKARYITGDEQIFEKQIDGSYLQTGTLAKTSDLRTKTSQLENDSGFLTDVDWDDISQKPFIPTKTSELQNDEGFLKDVTWEQVQNKPDIATSTQLEQLRFDVDEDIALKLNASDYDATSIRNSYTKIDVNGNVYEYSYTPGYYTPWTYSDGQTYPDPLVYGYDDDWYIAIDQDTYKSQHFETEQQAQSFLDTALTIDFSSSTTTITATREYVDPVQIWTKTDELAYKSDIEDAGISEEECRTIVESYEYQTAEQVEDAIDGKGFRTESQVESQITAKGYQTESQVQAIAAATLPTGFEETTLIGTLEDDTEVSFIILTKAIS